MLAEHWNGSAWSQVPTPNVVRFDEKLNAVSAAASNDIWAVGSIGRTSFKHTDPLAAHWDGTSWTIVPTPFTTGSSRSALFGVANLGGGNAWAVGRGETGHALAEHWDGSAWTVVPTPDPAAPTGSTFTGSTLTAVSARAANDIWAVVHWNGTAWTPETTPVGPDGQPGMNGVSAVPGSATEVWAVGITLPSGRYHTFAMHHP